VLRQSCPIYIELFKQTRAWLVCNWEHRVLFCKLFNQTKYVLISACKLSRKRLATLAQLDRQLDETVGSLPELCVLFQAVINAVENSVDPLLLVLVFQLHEVQEQALNFLNDLEVVFADLLEYLLQVNLRLLSFILAESRPKLGNWVPCQWCVQDIELPPSSVWDLRYQ